MVRKRVQSSRLTRTSEKQNKKQVILFTVGIIIVIFILLEFGPLIINVFGNAVYSLRGGDKADNTQITGNALLDPPVLNGIPDATQSAQISFNGTAPETDGTIELYVNNNLEKEIQISDKVLFNVDSLSLSKGNNTLKAKFKKGNKTSDFTQEYNVSYSSEKPNLNITFPTDGTNFTHADKTITVAGTTDPDDTVIVNGFVAIVDGEGKFTYTLQLNDGDNNITIESQNPAGTTTQKQLKVHYQS